MSLSPMQAETLGQTIIELLNLEVKSNGKVETRLGEKTPQALGRSIIRLNRDFFK